jgi:hypothetical protein
MPDGRTFEAYVEDYRRMLEQIASGTRPSDEELSRAPLISGWIVDEIDYGSGLRHKHIFGSFEGHPFIAEGSYGRTSPLLQLDRGLEWARCRSRVYRLRDALTKSKVLAGG